MRFEDMDDPTPPEPGARERAAVARRVTALRRRRAAQAGAAASLALVASVGVLTTRPSVPRDSLTLDDPGTEQSPSASPSQAVPSDAPAPTPSPADPTPTPVATTAAPPTRSPSPPPPPSTRPSPAPAPTHAPPTTSPEPGPGIGDDPDGKPGWSTGFTGCWHQDVGESSAPARSLSIALELAEATVAAGDPLTGVLRLTNNGTADVEFAVEEEDRGTLVDGESRSRSAYRFSDAIMMEPKMLEAGASITVPVEIATRECGDTSEDEEPPLPAGAYTAVAWVTWSTDGGWGTWYAQPVAVELT